MSSSHSIEAHKITKPIQLLGAWLLGLILVNASFLGAAISLEQPIWLRATLVIASVINVPLFLVSIFLLQTKFRPEMQEDSYYHDYLLSKDGRARMAEAGPVKAIPEGQNGIWAGYSIQLNRNLKDYKRIEQLMLNEGVPISTYFGGSKGHNPPGRVVSFGRGFSSEQVKSIIQALKRSNITHVDYAADEEKVDEYNNMLLIGSYVASYDTHSVPISVVVEMVNDSDFSADRFYSEIIMAHEGGVV